MKGKTKKQAKRFLDGNLALHGARRVSWMPEEGIYVSELIVAPKLRRAVYAEAYRRGWDGNHWDDPFASYQDADGNPYF